MSNYRGVIDEAFHVTLTMRERMDVTKGVLDRDRLILAKQNLMKFAMDYLKDDIIEVKQEFVDRGGQAVVDLSIDAVVLRGEEYRALVKRLEIPDEQL